MIWKPNVGPQTLALQSSCFETLYGGARGGGKTDAGMVWLIKPYLINNPRYRALVIRKNANDLSDWIDRARHLYARFGAEIVGKPYEIRFPSGAKIRTGHLKDENAYTNYQGHEYQRILLEELTQIPQEKYYIELISSCRSTVSGIDARVFATTNPGGLGHGWVKKRFIDVAPWGTVYKDLTSQQTRVFIPAKLEDNPVLMAASPMYLNQLEALKDTDVELWKAWRLGDWDTFAGQFFREFDRRKHIIRPFRPDYSNKNLTFLGGLDWGRTDAFAFLAAVVMRIEKPDMPTFYRTIIYHEVYGTNKIPREWATIIGAGVELQSFESIQADNQIFAPQNDGSMDIAQQFRDTNSQFYKLKAASKDRVGGWENIHNWLSIAPDGLPYLLFTEDCFNLIRTLPDLVYDENNKQDVDTDQEDHAPDALRYLLKHLKWIDARLGKVTPKSLQRLQQIQSKLYPAPDKINADLFVDKVPKGGWSPV